MDDKRTAICVLCRCYGEISDVIDLDSLKNMLTDHPLVSSAEIRDCLCLEADLEGLSETIRQSGANKVLIAACSPLARGDPILRGLKQRGIHPADLELVDIREGCAWIHKDNPQGATGKAWDLINMGLASLVRKERSEDTTTLVRHEVLVLGAGPAGLAAAASLGQLGVKVHLVERSKRPGGMLNLISRVAPDETSPQEKLAPYLKAVDENTNITYYPSTHIDSAEGTVGNFAVKVQDGDGVHTIHAGAVIVSTGAQALLPQGLYRYGKLKGVLSAIELERHLKAGPVQAQRIVFIQCVAARDQARPYCSAICCPVSLKNAMALRKEHPESEVFILHRDIICPGSTLEHYYRKTMAKGVKFIRFEEQNPPVIEGDDHVSTVRVYDTATGTMRELHADMVVLSTPLAAHKDTHGLARMLGLTQDHLGFLEVHPLMHPVETTVPGIFICGSARWPVLADRAITQGEAAAMKAFCLVSGQEIAALGLSQFKGEKFAIARVDQEACTGCGNCVHICPYEACTLGLVDGASKSTVDPMRCTGCGTCVAVCPNGSIQLPEQDAVVIGEMLAQSFS